MSSSDSSSTSHAQMVAEFTRATSFEVPNTPRAMTKEEVFNVCRHVMSEMRELMSTVMGTQDGGDAALKGFVDEDAAERHRQPPPSEVVAEEQVDALVDAEYYMLNAAAKAGLNVDRFFAEVHRANMAKVDPTTGKVRRRESDGKVLKPEGWQAPDLSAVMRRCQEEGSW